MSGAKKFIATTEGCDPDHDLNSTGHNAPVLFL
jgi:hypothetical protein